MEYFIPIVVLVFLIIFLNNQKRKKALKQINTKKNIILKANKDFKSILGSNLYFNNRKFVNWKQNYNNLTNLLDLPFQKLNLENTTIKALEELANFHKNGRSLIDKRNIKFVERELNSNKRLFDKIENYSLNKSQREAIVHDEDNNLVIAGAGTGKTTAIVGKAIYLIETEKCKPDDILLLAFTRNAANEIRERIADKIKVEMNVRTFHSFGLNDVIAPVLKEVPSRAFDTEKKLKDYIYKIFKELLNKPSYRDLIVSYLAYYLKPYRSQESFENEGDYWEYLKSNSYQSIMGETLKSLEEIEIANFLFLHNVRYEYEADYKYRTATRYYRQYQPDFYLPDFDIYIEHFAIDRNGNPPNWFSGDYRAGIKWKRKIHKMSNTKLIETYSFEKKEGSLLTNLEGKLLSNGVTLKKRSTEEVIRVFQNKRQKDIPLLINLFITFLNLLKSNQYSINKMEEKAKEREDNVRTEVFLKVFKPIFKKYQLYLKENGKIDFSDMLTKATKFIKEKKYKSPFKYILIDEFQDMSVGRYKLIKSIIDQNKEQKLFCVGDDWQSIYRFTGSDLSIMVDFENHFGFTKRTDLDTSYRFTNKIAEFSSTFIQKNPHQLRKSLKTHPKNHTEDNAYKIFYKISENDDAPLTEILDEIQANSNHSNVFVIGRYNFNKPQNFDLINSSYPDIKIQYLTAHSSKGLETDVVIIDSVNSGKYGFPTEIIDDPILNLVLTKPDDFPNAEERRLFYVALTRARKKIFLLTEPNKKSNFIVELEKQDGVIKMCSSCKSGYLIKRNGEFGEFYGCSNYPYCKHSENIDAFDKEENNAKYESIYDEDIPF
ncbi:MAG: UvrD-helicase domain-containing protein [Bacteroidetes bacterium]|nr:UvrD-helicase domain-containing protein [Bacteroidota bacterium]